MKVRVAACTRRRILTKAVKFAGAALIPPGFIGGSPGKGVGGYAPKLSVEGYIWTQYFASRKVTLAEGEEEALRETHQAGYHARGTFRRLFHAGRAQAYARPAGEISS